ncbi:pseudouridine synthase [Vibrio tapetis]|uniref:Pseudouridine synthase n=1 Tax=Vibrio tapetis subsp. tapetis TaxID=1671868 RepID=A0A2N8ZME4_9VIBR|nr:RluA family pseudouridine synthase [Vibrio tapetis]SON53101.1 Pseudouridine synthase [Vibrio tapetis subsp. tapetis]
MPTQHNAFTHFASPIDASSVPDKFTFPFYYQAHPLCEQAARQLQHHLETQTQWQHHFGHPSISAHQFDDTEKATGKMFGVLVVKNTQGEIGFLSAFSGKIADQNILSGFVPPVFDMLKEDGFFRDDTDQITAINLQVTQHRNNPLFDELSTQLQQLQNHANYEIEAQRQSMILSRAARKATRVEAEKSLSAQTICSEQFDDLKSRLGKQSVAEKNQQKILKRTWQEKLDSVQSQLSQLTQELDNLKEQRAILSLALQHRLFSQYHFLNRLGEQKSLIDIFEPTKNPTPPAGAGECAAPKLLHYAYKNELEPICMAEFWWGSSPKSEVRLHKKYYPSCQSKCEPILGHMLKGMKVDDNPLLKNPAEGKELDILYQDEAIVVVNKPAEFLSVPGRTIKDSAYYRLQQQFTDVEGPFVIHRLDMSTSGILVFALTKRANKSLQKQFITRHVEKRYVALVDGIVEQDVGKIELPLRGDLDDRPRQMVCEEHGKAAETTWQVIERADGKTKLYLHPKTGRTHQLRVHCAHYLGLNMPIIGDDLYGMKANRLHLHAESLSFDHPYTKQPMHFQVDAQF